MIFFPHFVVVLLLSFQGGGRRCGAAAADDVQALLEFKKGITSDPNGYVLGSWNPPPAGSSLCPAWHGVTCDGAGNVVALDLDRLGLVGDLKFATLASLTSLKNLSLAGNAFTGRLAPIIGGMTSLQRIDLSGNQFYGPIPERITELTGLFYLNISGNNFSNAVPSGISNLQQLRAFDLRSNGLWGDIAQLLSELRYMEYVDLSSNGFTGNLLIDAVNLTGLGNTVKYLNLSNNQLSGGFFSLEAIQTFKNLAFLDLSHNQLNGVLPSFDSVYSLVVFRASGNQFSRSIPVELFGSTVQLEELDLSGNQFTGTIPAISSRTLKLLNLSSNALSGSLPSNVQTCVSVDFSNNRFSGDLSIMSTWGSTLQLIDLSSNELSGNYPSDASNFQNLTVLSIRNNSLVGALPSVLGNYPGLSILDLSLNKLNGTILPTFFISLSLRNLNLSHNQLSGSIPLQTSHSSESLVLPSYPHLQTLDLSDNSLSGQLPPEIGNLKLLKYLDLHKNTLSGELPNELSKLSELEFLDLSLNQFKGSLPDIPQPGLKAFNVSYNDLSGTIPQDLLRFPKSSFYPGNDLLVSPNGISEGGGVTREKRNHHMRSSVRVAFIIGSIGAALLVLFAIVVLYMIRSQELCGNRFRGQATRRELKLSRFGCPNMFKSPKEDTAPNSVRLSNDHLLKSTSRSLSVQKNLLAEAVEYDVSSKGGSASAAIDVSDNFPASTGERLSPGSPLSQSPRFPDAHSSDQPVMLDVYSPDRLAGELFFLDSSLIFTPEELSRAPAEVLGRSSHGTSYKATLNSGHMLTVKWLRVGLVRHKKEFAKEAKKLGTIRHPNIIPWRAYYWGPREQERLIISDYVFGDSLALYLYESTPRRYSRLSVNQRLKIAIDMARCLLHLHAEKGLVHGSLKPTNVLLTGPDLTARLTDYGIHRLMTQSGISEQILNLGALGYRAPELATASKPCPSFKGDVYAFGVILMEMLTRRSAGDIISGQSGAVDLTDWVQMCNREGRGTDCFDREIAGLEEAPTAMDALLAVSLRCILPVNERPNITTVYEDLCSITM